jgi:hypothetical protein
MTARISSESSKYFEELEDVKVSPVRVVAPLAVGN